MKLPRVVYNSFQTQNVVFENIPKMDHRFLKEPKIVYHVFISFQQRDDHYVQNMEMQGVQKYSPAIYTHCYDTSGTRLFAAGGPLQIGLKGNYIALFQ